jgi:hypothetical protein
MEETTARHSGLEGEVAWTTRRRAGVKFVSRAQLGPSLRPYPRDEEGFRPLTPLVDFARERGIKTAAREFRTTVPTVRASQQAGIHILTAPVAATSS